LMLFVYLALRHRLSPCKETPDGSRTETQPQLRYLRNSNHANLLHFQHDRRGAE
jgi:hypothetical protein